MSDVPGLWAGHIEGLSNLRNGGGARPRVLLIAFLYGVPLAVGVISWTRTWDARGVAEALLGAFAMMSGVLIGVFTLMATWRTRLDARASNRPSSEAEARRYVSAAAAHSMVAVTACVAGSAASILRISTTHWLHFWSALLFALSIYVGLLVLLVVRSAFVSFALNVDPAIVRADRERARQRL